MSIYNDIGIMLEQMITLFKYNGIQFFTTVTPYQPELEQRIDWENEIPFCGIEFTTDDQEERDITLDFRNYSYIIYCAFIWQGGSAKDAIRYKWDLLETFKSYLRKDVARKLHYPRISVDVKNIDISAEDILFKDKQFDLGQNYGAFVIEYSISGVPEQL